MSDAALFWEAVILMWLVLWVGFAGAWLWYRRPSRWAWRVWWRRVQSPPSHHDVRLPPTWTTPAAKGGEWQRQRLNNVIQMSERRR